MCVFSAGVSCFCLFGCFFVNIKIIDILTQHIPICSIPSINSNLSTFTHHFYNFLKKIYAKSMCIGNQYQTNFINTHAKHTQLLSSFINVFHWGPTFHLMTFALILALQAFQKILITLIRCITLALKLN